MWAENNPGYGAAFCLTVPVAKSDEGGVASGRWQGPRKGERVSVFGFQVREFLLKPEI
jgi:hypothetical protein